MAARRRSAVALIAMLAMASAHVHGAPSLGAHVLVTQSEGKGVSPVRSPPLTTDAHDSALLVLSAGYSSNHGRPADSYGNRFRQVGGYVAYANEYGDRFDTQAFLATPARGGNDHVLTLDKPGDAAGEISIVFAQIRHAGGLKDFYATAVRDGAVVSSGAVTTTGPATLIAVWLGDGGVKQMQATPADGFTTIDSYLMLPDNSGVQCAVAWRQVDTAGTWHVHWTATPVQGAVLWLFAFQ
jgi:hypothetical protein